MKIAIAFALLTLLSGCAQENVKQMLSNLDRDCAREYQGSIGGTLSTPTVTFHIVCSPSGTTTTTTVASPVKP